MNFGEIMEELESTSNLRTIPAGFAQSMVDLTSNDYLGLAKRDDLSSEFLHGQSNSQSPMTSSASRLLAGRQSSYRKLESRLSELYRRNALLFNSGYHANTGIVGAIASLPGTLVLADRLIHASIIDGIILSRAPFKRFRHNDGAHLEQILSSEQGKWERILIIAESVYSMDGDYADINYLSEIKRSFPKCMLYVDEAHAIGVDGPSGLGLSIGSKYYDDVDIIVGTFGKALASSGAFCVASRNIIDFLVNKSRSLIFSTAIPPIIADWSLLMLETAITMSDEREKLKMLGKHLSQLIGTPGEGHIQPVTIGDAHLALEIADKLREANFAVLPIRTPTVPPGTERLRISLSASLTIDDIESFAQKLNSLMK